ncbi:Histone-lysine N-methyltransferase SETMAR, partial [Habropoda laboriosa]
PALVNRRGPILLRDNARPHLPHTIALKLHQLGIEVLPHSSNSSDLSPTDFHFLQ